MESLNPMLALYGGTNECVRTNTILLQLTEVNTGRVALKNNANLRKNSLKYVRKNSFTKEVQM